MKPISTWLRSKGFISVVYLDDWFLIARSYSSCIRNINATIEILQSLGFIINFKKSQLEPAQICKYLGFNYDSINMLVSLPKEKIQKILQLISSVKLNDRITIRHFAHILGVLVSCCPAVNYSWA